MRFGLGDAASPHLILLDQKTWACFKWHRRDRLARCPDDGPRLLKFSASQPRLEGMFVASQFCGRLHNAREAAFPSFRFVLHTSGSKVSSPAPFTGVWRNPSLIQYKRVFQPFANLSDIGFGQMRADPRPHRKVRPSQAGFGCELFRHPHPTFGRCASRPASDHIRGMIDPQSF